MRQKNMDEAQNRLTLDDISQNLQINYIIMEKLWRFLGNKPEDWYWKLDITQNKYSEIRTGQYPPTQYLKKKWDEKESPLQKTGLPREIMLGEKMLEIRGVSEKEWSDYLKCRYESTNKDRKTKMRTHNDKLKKAFSELTDDVTPRSNIQKLFYFMKRGVASSINIPDREMKELQEALKRVRVGHIKACNSQLRKDIERQMETVLRQIATVVAYENLE